MYSILDFCIFVTQHSHIKEKLLSTPSKFNLVELQIPPWRLRYIFFVLKWATKDLRYLLYIYMVYLNSVYEKFVWILFIMKDSS